MLQSPPVTLDDLRKEIRTLETPGTDKMLAKQEFLSSPMYRNLIISTDGRTTAITERTVMKRPMNNRGIRSGSFGIPGSPSSG